MAILATQVFTPNDFPVHTYVERGSENLEQLLRNAIDTPKAVISLSGPSKSGKTVLAERVIGNDNLIKVSGAEITEAPELWDRILDWMGAPEQIVAESSKTSTNQVEGQVSAGVSVPLVAKGEGQVSYQHGRSGGQSTSTTVARQGLAQIVKEIADSDFAVLVDDFHYMPRKIQAEAAKQIKTAAERGVRILVASVPHRADDVVRSNPELRGRTTNIDTKFWRPEELAEIAVMGFGKLNTKIEPRDAMRLANEACGSPQLMQGICLQACYRLGLREASPMPVSLELTADSIRTILETTSLTADYSSLVERMHQGPKTRGVERKEFRFRDGSKGDVYRCVLLAIAEDPPVMTLPYTVMMSRVEKVCVSEFPVGSSVKEACTQIAKFALSMYPSQRIVEFDDESGTDTFSIVDPYWLFYLRASPKLATLAKS
jgi:hypothetical protein